MQRLYGFAISRARDVKDSLLLNSSHMQRVFSTATAESPRETSSGRRFASYTIFKGKAALAAYPVLPKFCTLSSGSSKMEKSGVVMLVFWPAIGTRKYDWRKNSSEGQIKKSLTISPINDRNGYFANLNVVDSLKGKNDRLSVAITKAEFSVLRTACSYVLPHIMGWDQVVSPEQGTALKPVRTDRPHPDFEWSR